MMSQFDLTRFYEVIIRNLVFELGNSSSLQSAFKSLISEKKI